MPTNDFDSVVERLGITQEDVEDLMLKTGEKDPDKAVTMAVMLKSRNPPLPKNPQVLDKAKMQYDDSGLLAEMLTGGVGGGIAGSPGGVPGIAVGAGLGATLPLFLRGVTDTPGEAVSADRVLDVASGGAGKGISMISKFGSTAKAATNTAVDSLMNYATGKANQAMGKEDSPLTRAGASAGLNAFFQIPLMRQAGRQLANTSLLDKVEELAGRTPAKRIGGKFAKVDPMTTQGAAEKNLQYFVDNPDVLGDVGKFRAAATMKGLGKDARPEEFQKFIQDNPAQIYDYVLKPVVGAKNVDQLREGAPVFAQRLKTLSKLAGPENGADVAKGLRTSFFDSIATNDKGTRISNPDSFKKRLEAIGPEATNLIFNDKESYTKLVGLADAASKAGVGGRFLLKFGDGGITILKKLGAGEMIPLDKDRGLGGVAASLGKTIPGIAMVGKDLAGPVAAGVGGYEAYKFTLDKLWLDKANKKTLDLLTKGLQLSGNNAVVDKFSEWLAENASETFKF